MSQLFARFRLIYFSQNLQDSINFQYVAVSVALGLSHLFRKMTQMAVRVKQPASDITTLTKAVVTSHEKFFAGFDGYPGALPPEINE